MASILHSEVEGGLWKYAEFSMSEELIMEFCIAQKLADINPYHKVLITDGSNTIHTTAIMFHNGTIWDAILSGYTRTSFKRRLPKCWSNSYQSKSQLFGK